MAEAIKKGKSRQLRKSLLPRIFRIFVLEGLLFSFCLIIGVFTAFKVKSFVASEELALPTISILNFFLSFLLVTLFLIFLTLFRKLRKAKGPIYKTLFVLAVFWGGSFILTTWMGITGLIAMGILVFLWFKIPRVFLHDFVVILGMAGAGSLLGLGFTPEFVIVFLAIFSLYDFIAVYKTKHMIKMAKDMMERKAILGLVIPLRASDFLEDLKEVQLGGRFLILGGGDVVFPLLLAVSTLSDGLFNALVVVLFALAGLFLSFWLFAVQKTREPIPALPPIALASVIGYLIAKLIT